MTLQLPVFPELAAALAGGGGFLAVGGATPSARPLVLASLAREGWPSGCALAVVPRLSDAEELVAGLELLAPDLRTAVVPAELAAPYLGAEPPLASRLELSRLLARLAGHQLDLVVAPARALLERIPDPRDIERRTIVVRRGEELDTSALALSLVELGYRRTDLVEVAGEFAIRGAVVDVHPGGETGIRIELDDVRVETIRGFDPATQRSTDGDALPAVELLPLDPFPADRQTRERLAASLERELPALAGMIRAGAERRLWWPALPLAVASLSWFEVTDDLVVCDRDEVTGDLGRWLRLQEREWEALCQRHTALPSPGSLLVEMARIREEIDRSALRIERLEIADGTTRWWRLVSHPQDSFVHRLPDLVPTLRERRARDMAQVLVVASRREERRFAELLNEGGIVPSPPPPGPGDVSLVAGRLEHGFTWDGGLAVYGRRDLTVTPRPRRRRGAIRSFASDLRDLKPGDLVVHADHGIGRFTGFRRVDVEGRTLEMLVLTYHGGDNLLVPVQRADLLQRYAAGDTGASPRLDRLGGSTWRRRKARVKKAVREMAAGLLRLAAVRRTARGHAFSPDSPWQREFEDAFEFQLTPDQEQAAGEIKQDMESVRPMDRLLVGDVGYGKTEVAMRAAFKAVLDGKQVAVLAPTTILAEQHLETFRRRMRGFPIEIRMVSRFVSAAKTKEALEGAARGTVDVLIGTHRLLAADVVFRDLGLIIVDEEQRFGVAQKERLKKLRTEVDVVSMSATPIPRTLNMALSGLRDVSLIETPPRNRQAVETSVLEFSEEVVREAILYEMERRGQVFFVHNRVRSIGALAQWLERIVPEARIAVAHGQMPEHHLEKAMRTFLDGDADVLLATAIIENGLDIPNANTLLVNRADRFGLAQLYQLRGRVGRSERLAFAYFLVPPGRRLSAVARARLAAIQEFCELGAGFRIAARDLEIRGAGNLLGAEQHGFLEAVGFETYCQLLDEAVAELEGRPAEARREVELRLGLDLQLPAEYMAEPALRLSFYKRLGSSTDEEELDGLMEEVRDRYGPPPGQLQNLAYAQRVRIAAGRAGVRAVIRRPGSWRLKLDPGAEPPPGLAGALDGWPGARITPAGEIELAAEQAGASLEELIGFLIRLAGGNPAANPGNETTPRVSKDWEEE
ncbi:MAG: transcription-repair coupling factor [Acidobacteria bacterium]|nr:transcription-repair coupling factor [Acidobacteriota bacterium]